VRPVNEPAFFAAGEITVVIASLAVGGAERIVVDWAARIDRRWQIHLAVLFDQDVEWTPPDNARVTRFHGRQLPERLHKLAVDVAASDNPVCVCHLLAPPWLKPLDRPGLTVIYVYHNAPDGWETQPRELPGNTSLLIAVSAAGARDLRAAGWRGPISIIRHIPPRWKYNAEARAKVREKWRIPPTAIVVGMIGGIKPQKNYGRAMDVIDAHKSRANVTLVIIGGQVNTATTAGEWERVRSRASQLGERVVIKGAIPGAAAYLPAFDVLLNTSDFEGLSISTLEALIEGLPVVASQVGGQGELASPDLHLVQRDAPISAWLDALTTALQSGGGHRPEWADFPTFRLWTMAGIAPRDRGASVLFCTNDLNTGGAQRSLLNLLDEFGSDVDAAIAVCRRASSHAFPHLVDHDTRSIHYLSDDGDAFTCAESIVALAGSLKCGTVCFWSVDAKIRLLVAKALHHSAIKLVDVSPGPASIRQLCELRSFQTWIGFSEIDYYEQLRTLVLKYRTDPPERCRPDKVTTISNGVVLPQVGKIDYSVGTAPRVVSICRIARTKHVLELVLAFVEVRKAFRAAELHIYGHDDNSDADYLAEIQNTIAMNSGRSIFLHRVAPLDRIQLHKFDAAVVLGSEQGCPNAVLEAMAAALPTVTNADGGTGEQIEHGISGILVDDCDPLSISRAVIALLRDREWARRLGQNARSRMSERFSMREMARRYRNVVEPESDANVEGAVTL